MIKVSKTKKILKSIEHFYLTFITNENKIMLTKICSLERGDEIPTL